jgi:putative ABC transport system ATP-binding protein
MNLLLNINNFGYSADSKKCTMIMVTHNPDLECYADRILYIKDGKIVKQVLNYIQTPLELSSYLKYLNINNQD